MALFAQRYFVTFFFVCAVAPEPKPIPTNAIMRLLNAVQVMTESKASPMIGSIYARRLTGVETKKGNNEMRHKFKYKWIDELINYDHLI